MMLGDMLAAARRSGTGVEVWLRAAEPDLLARLSEAAAQGGDTVAGFVRAAVADFTQTASGDAWADLTSRLRESEDPGRTCLAYMIGWKLTRLGRTAETTETQDER